MPVNWQYLTTAPNLPALYLRAATRRKITGQDLPDQGLRGWVTVDAQRLADYRSVCGFADDTPMPATYPQVLALPLQLQLLTARDFPFPLLGLIHLNNRIRLLRPLGGQAQLRIGVQLQNLQPHAKGATFDLLTQVDDALGPLWQAESRLLCRGVNLHVQPTPPNQPSSLPLSALGSWPVPADIGWRYAKVSGDYNPIHLTTLSARLFGQPRAIAHGMWSKARALAALHAHLPSANIEIDVAFKQPLRLPGEVGLWTSAPGSKGAFRLSGTDQREHLSGVWRPID